jgi:hypothetical protein
VSWEATTAASQATVQMVTTPWAPPGTATHAASSNRHSHLVGHWGEITAVNRVPARAAMIRSATRMTVIRAARSSLHPDRAVVSSEAITAASQATVREVTTRWAPPGTATHAASNSRRSHLVGHWEEITAVNRATARVVTIRSASRMTAIHAARSSLHPDRAAASSEEITAVSRVPALKVARHWAPPGTATRAVSR